MRGDRPQPDYFFKSHTGFTPHARGSTLPYEYFPRAPFVYPACAGIDRKLSRFKARQNSLPRMRGDRPRALSVLVITVSFTPHARGSTLPGQRLGGQSLVYPACAGIDLAKRLANPAGLGLPRMRGDRPFLRLKRL